MTCQLVALEEVAALLGHFLNGFPLSGSRDITVGTTVAIIVEDKAAVTAFTNYSEGGGGASTLVVPTPPPSYASSTSPSEIVNSRLGPAARMLLSEAGLSRDQVHVILV